MVREAFRLLGIVLADMFKGSKSAVPHTQDSLAVVKRSLAKKKAVLIDVREQGEWNHGHLAQATLVPLTALSANPEKATEQLPKNKPIYIHCASGHRCVIAARYLNELGFDARPLRPGFRELVHEGFQRG